MDELLGRDELKVSALPPVLLRESVREELDALRDEVRGGLSALPETGMLCARILARAEEKQLPTLRSVINATGVTLHTNLGRACLSERAANAAAEAARDYSTLEYDVENGCRGSRYQHVEALLCRLTGAEAAMAVNSNARRCCSSCPRSRAGERSSPRAASSSRSAARSAFRRS